MVRQPSIRRLGVVFMDLSVVLAAYMAAFLLRFDLRLDVENLEIIVNTAPYVLAVYFIAAQACSLYRGIFHFSSFSDLVNIAKAVGAAGASGALSILFIRQGQFPRSVLILHPLLAFLCLCAVRFGIRLVKSRRRMMMFRSGSARRVLLVGAGELGESLLRQMLKTPEPHYRVVGLIDDDPAKWGMRLHGHAVLGGRGVIEDVLRRQEVDEVVVAIGTRRGEIVQSVMDVLRRLEKKPEFKIAPTLDEMLKDTRGGVALRKVKPADLLNRDVVRLDEERIGRILERKVVLVTGAGGTIGGELCRQVLRYAPEKIVLVDNHATSLFYIEAELKKKNRGTRVVPVLGDIRDRGLVERIFKLHHPQAVLHAAAHKHVHQLEFNVQEGVGNNVLGTYYLASAADSFGAGVFLLVSTDKAVRPSSVMGATKRVAELVVRNFAARSRTRFAGVRFGNVLGSSGSVLPIFQEQIAKGGPITLTDPDATRYFMTAEEAAGLILQAASMAKGGDVFLLKMGTPVRILDMAKNLLVLSGLEPGKDIEIQVIGLRQGEKLDEELVEDPSCARESQHPDIMLLQPEDGLGEDILGLILELELLSRGSEAAPILRKLQELVPTFQPSAAHPVAFGPHEKIGPARLSAPDAASEENDRGLAAPASGG